MVLVYLQFTSVVLWANTWAKLTTTYCVLNPSNYGDKNENTDHQLSADSWLLRMEMRTEGIKSAHLF